MELLDKITSDPTKTIIGVDSSFEGAIDKIDSLKVDGLVVCTNGVIKLKEMITVGVTGKLKCEKIHTKVAYVSGVVLGDIYASERVVLHECAKVLGNIYSAEMVTYKGAFFLGTTELCADFSKKISSEKQEILSLFNSNT